MAMQLNIILIPDTVSYVLNQTNNLVLYVHSFYIFDKWVRNDLYFCQKTAIYRSNNMSRWWNNSPICTGLHWASLMHVLKKSP